MSKHSYPSILPVRTDPTKLNQDQLIQYVKQLQGAVRYWQLKSYMTQLRIAEARPWWFTELERHGIIDPKTVQL